MCLCFQRCISITVCATSPNSLHAVLIHIPFLETSGVFVFLRTSGCHLRMKRKTGVLCMWYFPCQTCSFLPE